MNFILISLLDFVKAKVDQCSSAKSLWKKLHNIYSRKHADQEEDDHDHDSSKGDYQVEGSDNDEEEAFMELERELINALSDLRKI